MRPEKCQQLVQARHGRQVCSDQFQHDDIALPGEVAGGSLDSQIHSEDPQRFKGGPAHHLGDGGVGDDLAIAAGDDLIGTNVEPFGVDHQPVHVEDDSAESVGLHAAGDDTQMDGFAKVLAPQPPPAREGGPNARRRRRPKPECDGRAGA